MILQKDFVSEHGTEQSTLIILILALTTETLLNTMLLNVHQENVSILPVIVKSIIQKIYQLMGSDFNFLQVVTVQVSLQNMF